MFLPRREITLNVVMHRRIRFARNNAVKNVVKDHCDGNTRLPVFAAIFSPSRHYIARNKKLARFSSKLDLLSRRVAHNHSY